MLQVLQHQKSGEILIEDVPVPTCPPNGILVQNICSVISAGTEKTSVEQTQSSLIERIRKQPEQVRTVLENLKKEGIQSTINKVLSKLDSYKTLGYSTAGVVVESRCEIFSPGDRVACGGAGYATHSEFVSIPKNLACKIPPNVDFESASFATIGSIALQGVRQANPRLGEYVAVIGLGLIGLITVQLLKANGCFVAGVDIRPDNFELAKSFGCGLVSDGNPNSIQNLLAFTDGLGFDAVIITASTQSNEPTELALKIVRKKGRIVVVGSVGMNLPRSPFYEKELEYTIACSYGPGRYDKFYEEYGIDYPYPYVRWTENRNMRAFLDLIADNKINLPPLITHRFSIENAVEAYKLLTEGKENFIGILLTYGEKSKPIQRVVPSGIRAARKGRKRIGFIGAGNFAQFYLLPVLKNLDVELHTVSTATSANAISVARHFGFQYATTDSLSIIHNPEIDFVFIASRHDTHYQYVLESIKAQKPVFVEKPLVLNYSQLKSIEEEYAKNPVPLMVGYNRRFSPAFVFLKEKVSQRKQPLAIHYRVNAGFIPPDHWIQNPQIGGGRIIGEVCHFVDTLMFLTDSLPVSVFAETISHTLEQTPTNDTLAITIKFQDGSLGVIEYFSNGSSQMGKEYCEIFWENQSAILNNFESVSIYYKNRVTEKKFDGKKGHKEEMSATISNFENGESPIDFFGIKFVSLTTFAIIESLQTGRKILLNEFEKMLNEKIEGGE